MLRETGARPQEVARLTAEAVDWANGCARLRDHKGAAKGLSRTLHFSAAAMMKLVEQRDRHGSGLLFRTRAGKAFTKGAIVRRCGILSKRVGFRVIAYGCRHSFAASALAAGESDAIVAALLGHRDTAMVNRSYSHLTENARAMKAAAERISRRAAG